MTHVLRVSARHITGMALAIAIFVANSLLDFPTMSFTSFRAQGYVDMLYVLKSIECFSSLGFGVYQPGDPLTSGQLCPVYNYGATVLYLGQAIGLESSLATILSIVLSLAVVSVIALVITHQREVPTTGALILIVFIVASPAVQFLFERGNWDLLVFLIIAGAAYLFASGKPIISMTLVCLAALVKAIALPLLLLAILRCQNRRDSLIGMALLVFASPIVVLDILRVHEIQSPGYAQFGSGVWAYYLNSIGLTIPKLVAISLGIVGVIAASLLMARSKIFLEKQGAVREQKIINDPSLEVPLWSLVVYLFSFLTGFNYDYRLVFLATGSLLLLKLLRPTSKKIGIGVMLLLVSLWGSSIFGNVIVANSENRHLFFAEKTLQAFQVAGDISSFMWAALTLAMLITYRKSLFLFSFRVLLKRQSKRDDL